MKGGLDEVVRLKRAYRRWGLIQWALGALPIFALINSFQPILSDGYGHDLLPGFLPEALARHYHLILAACIAGLAVSEFLRRRFHTRHKADLDL